MTDDEIIAQAEAIKARRQREARAKDIMGANRIVLQARDRNGNAIATNDIDPSPELYAFLCHIFQIGDSK